VEEGAVSQGHKHDAEIETAQPLSRRATLLGAGAFGAGLVGASLARPSAAAAAVSNLYVVVDSGGGGDYTDLEAAVANTPPDSTIFVKHGTYLINNTMRPKAGVRILGEGYGSHVRLAAGVNKSVFVVQEDNVVFENVRIDGNGANQALASGNTIYYDRCQGGRVSGCWVHDSAGYAIVAFPGVTHTIIEANHVFSAVQEGIELQGASYCTVTGNVVRDCGENGIYLWNSTGVCELNAVVGNTVTDCNYCGIQVTDNALYNVISGNTVLRGALHGIVVNNVGPTTISDNVVRDNPRRGIFLENAPNSTVSGNVVANNGEMGIFINRTEGCSVVGNTSISNQWTGIEFGTYNPYAINGGVISGNVAANNGRGVSQWRRHGIIVRGPWNGVVVDGNRCYDSQPTKTQLYGIGVTDRYPSNVMLSGNIVDGNAQAGVIVDPGALATTYSAPYRKFPVTVGPPQAAIPHGLSYTPLSISIAMTSSGSIWISAPPDSNNIYLKADSQNRTANILVG
jgi:parallel beta-helix repeat protein